MGGYDWAKDTLLSGVGKAIPGVSLILVSSLTPPNTRFIVGNANVYYQTNLTTSTGVLYNNTYSELVRDGNNVYICMRFGAIKTADGSFNIFVYMIHQLQELLYQEQHSLRCIILQVINLHIVML